ncbi:hypothetical protein VCV18_012340 [Metarhizium anisopliae]
MDSKYCSKCARKLLHSSFLKDASADPSNRPRDLIYHVFYLNRTLSLSPPDPLFFHQSSLESFVGNTFNHSEVKPLDLFNQPSVQSSSESLNLFSLSSVTSILDPSRLESCVSNPLNHTSLKSLDLFSPCSIQCISSLKFPNLFNRSRVKSLSRSYHSSLESFNPRYQFSLKSRAFSQLNNGGMYGASTLLWIRSRWRHAFAARSVGLRWI